MKNNYILITFLLAIILLKIIVTIFKKLLSLETKRYVTILVS